MTSCSLSRGSGCWNHLPKSSSLAEIVAPCSTTQWLESLPGGEPNNKAYVRGWFIPPITHVWKIGDGVFPHQRPCRAMEPNEVN